MGDVGECGEKLCWLMYTVKRAGRCCVLRKPSQAKILETPACLTRSETSPLTDPRAMTG